MQIPHIKGKVAHQAHVGIPEGTSEEEYARNGFSGRYAHFYRTRPLVEWLEIEGPLKPQAYDLARSVTDISQDYLEARQSYLYNDDVRISFFRLKNQMQYFFRNADADEIFFIHAGKGRIETDFGPLVYEPGDYLVIPRGTVYRFDPREETHSLLIEAYSEVCFPEKGMLGQHALFDPAVIRVPTPEPEKMEHKSNGKYELRIQHCGEITRVLYPFHPLNAVGWKGTLSVWQLNVRDIRPVSADRYHLPPSAHTTFVANNFVICTFLPRPLENGDPQAMKVPFYHLNIDFDEVIFYHSGQFFSRAGIKEGMITFHPQGIQHGPQRKAIERAREIQRTDEVAVMIDARNTLKKTPHAETVELSDYWKSWQK